MYLHGEFKNTKGDNIAVYIVTHNDRTEEKVIGDDTSGIMFADDPIEITSEVNDTFDVILPHAAKIKLLTKNVILQLFNTSCREAVVNIYKNNACLFAGFIEPQVYSQGYNETYDELELSCIDVLSAIQYSAYRNIGYNGISYNKVKENATNKSFFNVIMDIIGDGASGLDLLANKNIKLYYDGSKAIDRNSANRYNIFLSTSISELLFLDDEEDNVWKQNEVLEEMLKYLNLHIIQCGLEFYIYDWESIKIGDFKAKDLLSNEIKEIKAKDIVISNDNVADCDTNLSIGEVYNQIALKCDVKSIESVIESPLDKETTISPFSNKQLYMTEYISYGEGQSAIIAFFALIYNRPNEYDAASYIDWFVQVMNNKNWQFTLNGQPIDKYMKGENQQDLLNKMAKEYGAALISFGKVTHSVNNNDDSLIAKIDMNTNLVVSINGNEIDRDNGKTKPYPNEDTLKNNAPIAIYKGKSSGGVFSPSDDETTNYIVISGDIALCPIIERTDNFKNLKNAEDPAIYWHRTVNRSGDNDGAYYTQKWYKSKNPLSEAQDDEDTIVGFSPYNDKCAQKYEYTYSSIGDNTDKISKVGVLACMLIIGDKCVVEKGHKGQITDFEWRKYKTKDECATIDEYYQQSFTIGFNPKIGDKLIGKSFPIQNNLSYTKGIDAEGTAIPIRKSDHVSGEVKFMILGAVNIVWDEITRVHPTFFRHTKWGANSVSLLSHVSSIFVKSFEIKVHSDNGLINNTIDKDLIYISDTDEKFINKKDDIDFKINSALTLEERRILGITDSVKMSVPNLIATGDAILSIYDKNKDIIAKPEQLYVDSYYNEYHKPKVVLEQNFKDIEDIISIFNHYTHPALGKKMFVQGEEYNLMYGEKKLILKQIND